MADLTLAEIQAKATAEALALRDDYTITQQVNADRVRTGDVSSMRVRELLFTRGAWVSIARRANAAQAGQDTSDAAIACQTLYDMSLVDQVIPMTHPAMAEAILDMLGEMVAAEVISEEDKTAVVGLSQFADPVTIAQVSAILGAQEPPKVEPPPQKPDWPSETAGEIQ